MTRQVVSGVVCAFLLLACTPKETTVQLSVKVKTNQGEPIDAAAVAVDGKTVGRTDHDGVFSGEVKLPSGAKRRIEVRKDSDTYYFAPYYQALAVAAAGVQAVEVPATLYFVPKPVPSDGKKSAAAAGGGIDAASGSGAATADRDRAGAADSGVATASGGGATTTDQDHAREAKAGVDVPSGGNTPDAAALAARDPAVNDGKDAAGPAALTNAAGPGSKGAAAASPARGALTPNSVAGAVPKDLTAPAVQSAGDGSSLGEGERASKHGEGDGAATSTGPAERGALTAGGEPNTGEEPGARGAPTAAAAPDAGGEGHNSDLAASLTSPQPADDLDLKAAAKGLQPEQVALTSVQPAAAGGQEPDAAAGKRQSAKAPVPPAAAKAPKPDHVFTVHVYAGSAAVGGVVVATGQGDNAALKEACTTNERGRCVVHFSELPLTPVTFVATRKGYKTAVVTAAVGTKNKLRINLEAGRSLDIYALGRTYNHVYGLGAVDIFAAGKRVGETDRYGHFSYFYSGKSDDLLTLALKPKGHLPEVYETDFVTSGEMQLIKYFTPLAPTPVRMVLLSPVPAGNADGAALSQINSALGEALRVAARRSLYASTAFKEYPFASFDREVHRAGKTGGEVLKSGWQGTELKATVDAVLVPTVVMGSRPLLELSVVDSQARVLAAATEELSDLGDKGAVERAVSAIAKKIARTFPFEGAVLSKEANYVHINLGQNHGRGVKVGDTLDVYGQQSEKSGLSQTHANIAVLTVKEVGDATAKCLVTQQAPRSTIERGDLVVLRIRRLPKDKSQSLQVVAQFNGKAVPVAQANVYLNNVWLGASDANGRVHAEAKGAGSLKIIKQGFADLTQSVNFAEAGKRSFELKRQAAFLRVDSRPAGAVVKVEGKVIGKTPLAAPIAVPAGFVKLELEATAGYKPYSQVLELDQGTLDLSGEDAIVLEPDLKGVAARLISAGKTTAALAALNKIPPEHSDYLLGRHMAGELYLTVLDEPAKAAEAFGIVTADPAVKAFTDKRFIGSHIDEGIALFMTAERLAVEKPEAAHAHYQKALEVLDRVVPFLRFVPSEDYAQAVHNVDYHRALCRHRLWLNSQDPRLLSETVKTWKNYLSGSARSVPLGPASQTYVKNAEVYLKQASASLNAARNVSKQ